MGIPLYQVDAFSDRPFHGNPACVCLMNDQPDDVWLQSVAAEINLSETAFVWKREEHFHIRWFTPKTEVKLCGHATLAAACVLWKANWLAENQTAEFQSLGGPLTAHLDADHIVLDFPFKNASTCSPPQGLLEGLGVSAVAVATDGTDFLVEVDREKTVRGVVPDFKALMDVDARGIIVTSLSSDDDFDFVSRFFAPACGIDEDPVTGSAHCMLGPYWGRQLNKTTLRAFQASSRSGTLDLALNEPIQRISIGGMSRIVFVGELLV